MNKEGVDVFVQTPKKILKNEFSDKKPNFANFWPWVQDRLVFLPEKIIESKKVVNEDVNLNDVKAVFKCPIKERRNHIQGGNYFFIKDGEKEIVLLGKDELKTKSLKTIRKIFDKHEVLTVSQPDFHLDLSIRPLNSKRILVHDSKMLLSELDRGIKNAKEIFLQDKDIKLECVIRRLCHLKEEILENEKQYGISEKYEKLQQELRQNNFDVIKVPGLIVKTANAKISKDDKSVFLKDVIYRMNFMNAIVHERSNKSLVYIVGKSVIDEQLGLTLEIANRIDFSFEKIFKKSLEGKIASEDIHFLGDNTISNILKQNYGGLHCLFAEVPKYKG